MGWEERRTLVLVCLAGIMERADEALLPAVYKEVGAAVGATPTGLGSLTLFRCVVQTACYPLAAFAALRYNRCHVIAAGAFLWAAATFLVAVSSSFPQVAFSRAFNGVGLALVTPAIQSLIADSTDDRNRGAAFGWLSLTSGLGAIFGGFFSIILASSSFMGIDGWRVAFHLVATVSVVVGILVFLYAVDPHFAKGASNGSVSEKKSITEELKEMVKQAKEVTKIASFRIIVAQGISGSFPWSAMSFTAMWLELTGFSHETTGVLMATFSVATSIGGFFGGRMGDFLAGRFPDAGRILLSQISSGSAIPFAAVLLLALPDDPSTGLAHGLVLFSMGLCISWNGPATNNPIFAEIVPERSRTSIYALDRSFESLLASFAPPVVGVLAQHMYGYKPVPRGSSEATSTEVDRENAASLAKALYTAIAIPMFVCCFIYSFLYCTYPRDRERARMDSLIESEMKNVDSENGCCTSDDGRTATHMAYGDQNFEIGDEDDNALLSHQVDFKN
ncbi:uncharacterized protein M6B38_277855 [Iris pallida]|uniref:Major facilitator superfamily (MFS) profile domain-containing protein n=1 Tax=Iris pallida TaxID=29817 RepID=A0AAX6HQZ4_IRIPA|nr:uncharacterized protein M6B38_296535 [Iris pallida]KAJ6847400.1 uncharacterized protein M6B38_277855 [Iris pallida]